MELMENMDESGGHYAKWNKQEKGKYHMESLIHGENKESNS